jgi:tetratricopeptide (TPR) repeat protein
MYSHFLLSMGRVSESLVQSERALELDPMSRAMNVHMAYHYLCAQELDKAIPQYQKTVAMFPDAAETYRQLALAYQLSGNHDQAVAELLKSMELQHENPTWIASLREAYQTGGIREFWRRYVWVLQQKSKKAFVPQPDFAIGYALSGDNDHAFEALNKGYQERDSDMAGIKSEPGLFVLHSDPRWVGLLRRLQLPN